MVSWAVFLCATLTTADVQMDSVLDEVTAGKTHYPVSNTAIGFFSNHLSAGIGIGDSWLLEGAYTFSATQGIGLTHTVELDATFIPDQHWALTLAADGSPPNQVLFPFCLTTVRGSLCVPVAEQLWQVGGSTLASYESGGESRFEWGADLGYSPHRYELRYTSVVGVRAGQSISEELWQHRFALGGVMHLFQVVDVDLRGAYYLYSSTTLDILERALTLLRGGPPIAPRQWEAALGLTAYFLRHQLSAKAGLLVGPYAERCLGGSSVLTVKVSGRIAPVRLWGAVMLQSDRPSDDPSCTVRLGRMLGPSFTGYASVGAESDF
jgi:hypothetical protein